MTRIRTQLPHWVSPPPEEDEEDEAPGLPVEQYQPPDL
jgi:hypothetical protein